MAKRRSPSASKAGGYRDDLAYIHDVGFGSFAASSAPWLIDALRAQGIDSGNVVDLGCGSGIWAAALLAAGYEVQGFDLSAAMIALARRRAPRATFSQQSFVDARLPDCAAVTALGEIFNYLFDGSNSPQRLVELFARIHQALQPRGMLIFDVATPGRVPDGQRKHFTEGPDWACLYEAVEDRQSHQLTRTIITFRKSGRTWRRDHEVHRLRLYAPEQLLAQLREVGFRVRTVRAYGQFKFPAGWIGFVARKA